MLLLAIVAAYLPGVLALPPVDRDEARFAQATRQMLASGDFVRPYFADTPRDKKPIGIYWLQAASVSALGSPRSISAYRVPSWIGALVALVLVARFARELFGAACARLAVALLGASLVMAAEATVATTDAVLLACIVASQGALARIWLSRRDSPPPTIVVLTFWAALGAGALVKGPVAPGVAVLTVAALCTSPAGLDVRWIARLRPLAGALVVAAMVLPWTLAVWWRSQGEFFRHSILGDIMPKLVSGHEGHGAPPGYYVATTLATFLPGAAFALPATLAAWRRRADERLWFCLAWLLPSWGLLEIVPTKLPHYVLPLLPPLALLVAWAVEGSVAEFRGRSGRGLSALATAVGVAIAAALLLAAFRAPMLARTVACIAAIVLGGAVVFAARARARGEPAHAAWCLVAGSLAVIPVVSGLLLPSLDEIWISRQAVFALAPTAPERPVLSVGYLEPSLVFLAERKILATDAENAARFLAAEPTALVLVAEEQRARFDAATAGGASLCAQRVADGWNYSRGRRTPLWLYQRPSGSADACPHS